jgi:CO/xanthine dehydrogenase FAD-binding subunit
VKAAHFSYLRPTSVAKACEALGADMDARILAGGQTLVPMMAMRLSRPSLLIDITRLSDLRNIEDTAEGVSIGAAVRQAEALNSGLIAAQVPLLAAALPNVGHPPTRSRGTVGGSIAHGDPSAEIALAAAILNAKIVFRTCDATETLSPEEFFVGPTVTMAPMGGLLTHIIFPKRPAGALGVGFREVASRRSDYAFASAGAQILLDEEGTCASALLGIGSVGDVPLAVDISALAGTRLSTEDLRGAVEAALTDLDCVDDLHATATYRHRAATQLAIQALMQARDQSAGVSA